MTGGLGAGGRRCLVRQVGSSGGPAVPCTPGCWARFTDERWKAIEPAGWDAPRETHPHLCDDCKQRAITAERQAEYTEHEHQEQDQVVPEQKADGWLSGFGF